MAQSPGALLSESWLTAIPAACWNQPSLVEGGTWESARRQWPGCWCSSCFLLSSPVCPTHKYTHTHTHSCTYSHTPHTQHTHTHIYSQLKYLYDLHTMLAISFSATNSSSNWNYNDLPIIVFKADFNFRFGWIVCLFFMFTYNQNFWLIIIQAMSFNYETSSLPWGLFWSALALCSCNCNF